MRYKIREVQSKDKIQGITIPKDIAVFYKGVHFTVEKSGPHIILQSGAAIVPTKEEVEAYEFADCRI